MKKRGLLLFFMTVLGALPSWCSHIVGGNLGYTLLGPGPGGTLRYRVSLITYTDCSPTSEIPYPESPVSAGIYFHNQSLPSAAKVLKQTVQLMLDSAVIITPPLPPGCPAGTGTCIYRGNYSAEILLEPTTQGYHLYYERCCRNTAIVNLLSPSQTSTAFYAFIPPSDIPNSSPVFIDDPVPLMCIQDSLFLVNTAYDPDGDFLLYSLVTPLAGFADITNPAPQPSPLLQWPINPVIYAGGGFSAGSPFGPGGFASVNSLNGFSVFKTSLTGNFSLCVQINEYRNGTLISSTRRDLQFISLVCPVNQPPVAGFQQGTNIQIPEGDTACFSFSYTDPEADSVFLSASGEPFTFQPPATFTVVQQGPSAVSGEICWTPPCGSARAVPYFLVFEARDDGCIPKSRINMVSITVVPDTADLLINGDSLVCGLSGAGYQSNKNQGIFSWSVTGGNITSGNGTPSVYIDWNLTPGDTGLITLIRTGLCASDTAYFSVSLKPPAFAGYIPPLWLCPGSGGSLEAEPGGSDYVWSPGIWLSDSVSASVVASPPYSLVYNVDYTDSLGCLKFDSVTVTVDAEIPVDAGNDKRICGAIPVMLGGNPSGPQNSVFNWITPSVADNPNAPNPLIQEPVTGWYVMEVNVDTCHGKDSVYIQVLPLPDVYAGNDTLLCAGAIYPLQGEGSPGDVFWTPPPGIENLYVLNPIFSAEPGIYSLILTITDTSGCSASDSVYIEIAALPETSISGPLSICPGDTVTYTALGAQSYQWSSAAYFSSPNADQITYSSSSPGFLFLLGTDSVGCNSADSLFIDVFNIQIQPLQDTVICAGESVILSAANHPGTLFNWYPADSVLIQLDGSAVVLPTQDITYTLVGISESGCTDSVSVNLYVKPLPVIPQITYKSVLFCNYSEVTFTAENIADSLYWFQETDAAGTGNEIILQLNTNAPGMINLVAVTEYGCKDTLTVKPDFEGAESQVPDQIPNIFTPDGDGVNDIWSITLPGGLSECTKLYVYNRWGTLVYTSDNLPVNWNGKSSSGVKLNDGIYFYVLETGGIFRKGTVTITR